MHSLTIAVKDELVSAVSDLTSQRVAELSTILRFAGGLHVIGGNIAVEVELDHLETAKRVRRDIRDIFGMATDAAVMQPSGNRTYPLYVVRVRQGGETL
ncbi:MAG: DNA-binding protein WhiA, partial [Microbacteriaceae bacterium]|nr:DNA-binding protein WhiA [Microbacteriaceae bacterium]